MTSAQPDGPTLEEIRRWSVTVDVTAAASALGVSRSNLYEQIRLDAAPVRTVRVGSRVRVVTASIIALLDVSAA